MFVKTIVKKFVKPCDEHVIGLTELGYGNNAVEMETTAIYDDKTKGQLISE